MLKYQVGFEWEEMRDGPAVEAEHESVVARRFALKNEDGQDSATVFVCYAAESNTYSRFEIQFVRSVESHVESVSFHSVLKVEESP